MTPTAWWCGTEPLARLLQERLHDRIAAAVSRPLPPPSVAVRPRPAPQARVQAQVVSLRPALRLIQGGRP